MIDFRRQQLETKALIIASLNDSGPDSIQELCEAIHQIGMTVVGVATAAHQLVREQRVCAASGLFRLLP